MKLSDYISTQPSCDSSENGFLIWQIKNPTVFAPCMIDGEDEPLFLHILVHEGNMSVKYNDICYDIRYNNYAVLMNSHKLEILSVSNDIRAFLMILTPSYAKTLTTGILPLSVSYILKKRHTPLEKMGVHQFNLLWRRTESIWECCMDKQHHFRTEQITYSFRMWLLDIANIYKKDSDRANMHPNRPKELFVKFMELLPIHVHREHSSGFYASILSVTPQYLNRIVKRHSGKTVFDWICQTLTSIITNRIETSDDSLQKMAEELNFPDQAALTKFYKRQTGHSPSEYRKSLRLKK